MVAFNLKIVAFNLKIVFSFKILLHLTFKNGFF